MDSMGAGFSEGLVELLDEHWNEGNLLEVVMLYEADAEIKEGETYYTGHAHIYEYFTHCRRPPFIRSTIIRNVKMGDGVQVLFVLWQRDRQAGAASLGGLSATIVRRQDDGIWLFHTRSNLRCRSASGGFCEGESKANPAI
jgi:hypothetical protein